MQIPWDSRISFLKDVLKSGHEDLTPKTRRADLMHGASPLTPRMALKPEL